MNKAEVREIVAVAIFNKATKYREDGTKRLPPWPAWAGVSSMMKDAYRAVAADAIKVYENAVKEE